MPQFIGGPYDGEDLPANPETIKKIRLPDPDTPAGFMLEGVIGNSTHGLDDWPHLYHLDTSVDPPVYRFVSSGAKES